MDQMEKYREVDRMLAEFTRKNSRATIRTIPVLYFLTGLMTGLKNPTMEEIYELIEYTIEVVNKS